MKFLRLSNRLKISSTKTGLRTNESNDFFLNSFRTLGLLCFFGGGVGNRSSFGLNDNSLSIARDSREEGTEVALLEKKKGGREGLLPLGNQTLSL